VDFSDLVLLNNAEVLVFSVEILNLVGVVFVEFIYLVVVVAVKDTYSLCVSGVQVSDSLSVLFQSACSKNMEILNVMTEIDIVLITFSDLSAVCLSFYFMSVL